MTWFQHFFYFCYLDFLSEILNQCLKEDKISTISLILSTFQTKASLFHLQFFDAFCICRMSYCNGFKLYFLGSLQIVHNTAVSKSQKLRFFTASTLTRIASLYRWNGVVDISTDHSVVGMGSYEVMFSCGMLAFSSPICNVASFCFSDYEWTGRRKAYCARVCS